MKQNYKMVQSKEEYRAQGAKNRRNGGIFERKVRDEMRDKGWIVDHFTNNIDLDNNKIITAKSNQWNSRTTGFPDFVMFKPHIYSAMGKTGEPLVYDLIFVECKCNGILSKKEKLKMEFLRKQGHKCFVAYKDETGKKILYRELLEYKEQKKVC